MTQNGWEDKGTNRNSYSWRGLELGSQEAEPERGFLLKGFTGRMLSGEGTDTTDIGQRRKVRLVSSRAWLQLALTLHCRVSLTSE